LATQSDDPDIRRLLAANPIPGQITLAYEREPDYFLGCGPMGHFCQVVVGRHRANDELVGLACRATRPMFVNGQIEEVGYLSQLRIAQDYQGMWLVQTGYRYLGQLHADGRVAGYLTTIIEGNTQAIGILVEKARKSLPSYREIQRLCTLALILRRPKPLPASPYELSRGSKRELGAIVEFLRTSGPAKQFYPLYTEADFENSSITLGFQLEDFILAWHKGRLAGVIGLWDQSAYKQTVVKSYHGRLSRLRPLYNAGLRLIGARPLTAPGCQIRFAYASFICTAENDPEIFKLLLQALYNLAATRGYAYLMVGLAHNDPLLAVARRYLHLLYASRLYTVCWPDGAAWHEGLDRRIPYVEIATL
jgi:hypothetical protein